MSPRCPLAYPMEELWLPKLPASESASAGSDSGRPLALLALQAEAVLAAFRIQLASKPLH